MTQRIEGHVQSATITAVVTRADGTQEDMGVVARYDSNAEHSLLERWWDSIAQVFKGGR